jgi:hypothetical protein
MTQKPPTASGCGSSVVPRHAVTPGLMLPRSNLTCLIHLEIGQAEVMLPFSPVR